MNKIINFPVPNQPISFKNKNPHLYEYQLWAHEENKKYLPTLENKNNSILVDVAWNKYTWSESNEPFLHNLEKGAFLIDGNSFWHQYPHLALHYYKKSQTNNPIRLFVDAYWNKSSVLFIPKNVQCATAIQLPFVYADQHSIICEKLIIIVQENSSVTIHDIFHNKNRTVACFRSIDCYVEKNAQLTYSQDRSYDQADISFSYLQFFAHERAVVKTAIYSKGAALCNQEVTFFLEQQHASISLHALCALAQEKEDQLVIHQIHKAPFTTSAVTVKQLVTDTASVSYKGTITIDEHAQGTVASQQIQALLLSEYARAHAQPEIEVLTHDVCCEHGSAVGQFDAEQLLYLQTRGLSYEQAKQLLLEAFIANVLTCGVFHKQKRDIIEEIFALFMKEKNV